MKKFIENVKAYLREKAFKQLLIFSQSAELAPGVIATEVGNVGEKHCYVIFEVEAWSFKVPDLIPHPCTLPIGNDYASGFCIMAPFIESSEAAKHHLKIKPGKNISWFVIPQHFEL